LASRRGQAGDPKANAAITLARRIVDERGWVKDEDLEAARQGGLTDGEISEVVANVALNIFTNYFNHVAGTEVDFPHVPELGSK
jgi:alkylhydroperoxidase family enzyme